MKWKQNHVRYSSPKVEEILDDVVLQVVVALQRKWGMQGRQRGSCTVSL